MRSFLEVSGLCSESLFAVIAGTSLWPHIRKQILNLLNIWTILHKSVEFLVCQQRRNLHNSEDFWVISRRSRTVSPFQELLFGLHSPFHLFLLVAKQGKAQAHLHGLPPLITVLRSKGTLMSVPQRKAAAALRALALLFQATRSCFLPPGLWVLWWNHETLNKLSKDPAQSGDCPWSHSPDRDFIRLLQWTYFWLTFSGKPQEVWWSMSENTNPRAHPIRVRGGSRSRVD